MEGGLSLPSTGLLNPILFQPDRLALPQNPKLYRHQPRA
jgi:hypothetical protein